MIQEQAYQERIGAGAFLRQKVADYSELVKLRLNLLVVFTTFGGYLLGSTAAVDWGLLLLLLVGGFMIVGSANGLNQILEKETDKLMKRTSNRPLAQDRVSVQEAVIFCTVLGLGGVILLGLFLNYLSAMIAMVSLISYAFLYTPMKQHSPVSVFVGAFPGAFPPLIGYVAATGRIDAFAISIFLIQFMWQFPHFWSIAWLLRDDYARAGYKLLPMGGAKDTRGAFQIMMFSMLMIPVGLLPVQLGSAGYLTAGVSILAGGYILYKSFILFRTLTDGSAKQLMFASFLYVPLIYLSLIIDKFFL